MDAQQVANLVSTLGFPILVAAWLLYRDFTVMRALDLKLERLIAQIDTWLARHDGAKDGR